MLKRMLLIALIVLGLPLLGVALSFVTAHHTIPPPNNDGIAEAKGLVVMGAIILGAFGLAVSLILGPIVAHFTRKSHNRSLSLLGYAIPSLAVFLYLFWGFISVVVVGNATPY